MSESSHEFSTENSITQVINRVWNALDVARRELAMHRDENLLTDTRNAFRRRRRAGRMSEFNNYICQSFPMISLNVIIFYLTRANKSRVLAKIQANTMNELRAAVGRSRMYIIPQTSITLPLEMSEAERTCDLPETSTSDGCEAVPQSPPASSSTSLMSTPIASSIAISAAPSPIFSGPSQSGASSSCTVLPSPAVPQCTPTPNSHASPQSSHLSTTSLSSVMDTYVTSPVIDLNPSLETSLESAQWLNAGTPEVFYRRSRLEPLNRVPDNDFIIDDSEDGEEDDIFDVSLENGVPLEEVDLCTIRRTFKEEHISDDQISIICISESFSGLNTASNL
ncbi:hypothetical protein PAMA_001912 [Pampus argenteus]